jgi:hypothetical protein
VRNTIHPFPNFSTFLFAHWFYTGGIQESQNEWNCLVNNVLLAPGFFPDDLQGNSLNALDSALDWLDGPAHSMFEEGGNWIPCSLEISIPITCTGWQSQHYMDVPVISSSYNEFGTCIMVPGFHYRKLVDVICGHLSKSSARPGMMHFVPYCHYWKPSKDLPEERVYNDLYTGNLWLQEHESLQRLPPVEGCNREHALIPMMWLSDAAHLTQFGQASIWPFYLQFGNCPKVDRAKPSLCLTEHIAYLPKVILNRLFLYCNCDFKT